MASTKQQIEAPVTAPEIENTVVHEDASSQRNPEPRRAGTNFAMSLPTRSGHYADPPTVCNADFP